MSRNNIRKQKGASILFAVLVLSFVLSISFGIASILMRQIKMLRNAEHSVVAFYAADAGIERVLMNRDSPENLSQDLSNGARFEVIVTPSCSGFNFCIKSIGTYGDVKRAIEIKY